MKASFLYRLLIDGLGRGSVILLTVALGRGLGAEGFGRFAFAVSFAGVVYFISEGGLTLLFLRDMGRTGSVARGRAGPDETAVWRTYAGVRLFLCGVAFAAVSLAGPWFWPWEGPWILSAVVGWMMTNSMIDFLNHACNALDRLGVSAAIVSVQRGLSLSVAIACLFLNPELGWVSFGLFAGGLAGLVIGSVILARTTGLSWVSPPAWSAIVRTLRGAAPLAGANVLGSLYARIGILTLPWLGFDAAIGAYGAAQRLFEAGYMVPAAFVSVALPRLARSYERTDKFDASARRAVFAAVAIGAAVFVVGQGAAVPAIRWLFGSEFVGAVGYLRVFLAVLAVVHVNYVLTTLLVVKNRLMRHAVHQAVCVAFCAALTFVSIRAMGASGAAWSIVATEMLLLALTAAALRKGARDGVGRPGDAHAHRG